ncbi:hypothetical protein COW82_00915 [Candidatus Campbellbacteria bacterium CG22_combo_CG10-13_8_21_14_all_43_18]|uniref:Vitamin K epoxide reductase domain-containing protein n=1 Tax=Candidatus Campbellbacteria bacterium CG22_combo_CG10-13_8_21_14_all_43_18 TaxID=1974530 RepID=A0A2H0DWT4_9BACT|nr:MAG: hypothetical protein COW82_00915 [Candidatus Campbellbacteria bacterium CG22_combo_CG10-13_8_21_14_all_43_18]
MASNDNEANSSIRTMLIQPSILLYFFLIILVVSGFIFPVISPEASGFYAFIAVMALGGLAIASYIYYVKRNGRELICPLGSDCNAVISSRYSKFLGIPLEYGGLAYYALIFVMYLCLVIVPGFLSGRALLGLSLLTSAAFLFSLYLLFVQAFILRQWCIWCIMSALLSIMIFIVSLSGAPYAISLLSGADKAIDFVHTLGFGLGLGSVSASLFLFLRFLRDSKLTDEEARTLKGTSEIIWLGLVLVLVSQFLSFVIDPAALSESSVFLVQTASLFISGISGAALLIIFGPLLTIIPFGEDEPSLGGSPFSVLEKPFFATASIALSSWYFAFAVEYAPNLNLPTLVFSYAVVLLLSVSLSLVWEKRLEKQ